ncbi:MAG: tRNA pseudouridine(55) synthase TruB [Fibrobacteres bacterium]|nr:tRNA pseudouridine(55) synthase TruB [Fibrobacterota bacterium]
MSGCGFLLLDKPTGKSSQQALYPVKRLLGERRVGHAGTLDPLATGLLVAAAGKATRLLSRIEGCDKEYLVCLRPGVRTDSLDTDGRILSESPASWEGTDWSRLLEGLLGEVDQIPPAYSAISVDGVRSYERARKGEDVTLPPRRVRIDSCVEIAGPSPLAGSGFREGDATLRIRCSKGTYVRSLVRDLGERAGFGACVSALRRTAIGNWRLPDVPPQTETPLELLPVQTMFPAWPSFTIAPESLGKLANGNPIPCDLDDHPDVLCLDGSGLVIAWGVVREGIFRTEALLADQILASAAS